MDAWRSVSGDPAADNVRVRWWWAEGGGSWENGSNRPSLLVFRCLEFGGCGKKREAESRPGEGGRCAREGEGEEEEEAER